MFVLLKTIAPSGGFWSKRCQKKSLERCTPVSVSTENGMPFFTLDVLDGKGGPDFQSIEKKCGCYVSRVVAPRSLSLPDSTKIKRFVPGASGGLFIFNTALKMIEEAHTKPEKISITVIDRNASMCGETVRLLPFSSSPRIVTSRPDRYTRICREIYDEYGASIMVRPYYEPCSKKEIVICCDGASIKSMNNAAVFSLKRGINGRIRFCGSKISLSAHHREFVPDNIQSTDFAAAITELCGSTAYRTASFSDVEKNCGLCNEEQPAKCLECFISCL